MKNYKNKIKEIKNNKSLLFFILVNNNYSPITFQAKKSFTHPSVASPVASAWISTLDNETSIASCTLELIVTIP